MREKLLYVVLKRKRERDRNPKIKSNLETQ
jgi:hypothetical protein